MHPRKDSDPVPRHSGEGVPETTTMEVNRQSWLLREVTELLISKGAHIEEAGDPVQVAITALEGYDAESLRMLLATDAGETCFVTCLFAISPKLKAIPHAGEELTWSFQKRPRDALPLINALVEAVAKLEARQESDGATLLLFSLGFPPYTLEAFIAAGANVHARDDKGRGASFHFLCRRCYISMDVDSATTKQPASFPTTILPLHILPASDDRSRPPPDIAWMDNLMETHGLDPRARDQEGSTLAHIAVGVGLRQGAHPSVRFETDSLLQYLVRCKASLGTRNCAGQTPLHALLDHRTGLPYDHDSALAHITKVLDFFASTAEVIDINAADNEGLTPLHFAAISTGGLSPEVIYLLQSHGADLRAKTKSGRNALHLSCKARNPESAGYLVDQAPELVHETDDDGRTPLFDACASGLVETVGALLRAGARVDVVDTRGRTPLDACAELQYEQKMWAASCSRRVNGDKAGQDLYRPSVLPCDKPETRTGAFARRENTGRDKIRETSPWVLENEGMALTAVVRALLEAGADPASMIVEEDQNVHDRGGCSVHSCIAAVLKGYKQPSGVDSNIGAGEQPRREIKDSTVDDDVLRDPWKIFSLLSLEDLQRLVEKGANLVSGLLVDQQHKSAANRYLHGVSFVESIVINGVTEAAIVLEKAARYGIEKASTPIDRWTKQALLSDKDIPISIIIYDVSRGNRFPQPEQVTTLGDLIQYTQWLWEPVLQVACRRRAPNMEMVRTLVERCGVDVLRPSLQTYGSYDVRCHNLILHTMAKEQAFWHLEAMRYLLIRGVQVDGRDDQYLTPLFVVLSNSGTFTDRFVELLLDFGADPYYKKYYGAGSCISLATGKSLDVFKAHGVVIPDRSTAGAAEVPRQAALHLF